MHECHAAGGYGSCALLWCARAAGRVIRHPGRPEPRTAVCGRHASRAAEVGAAVEVAAGD